MMLRKCLEVATLLRRQLPVALVTVFVLPALPLYASAASTFEDPRSLPSLQIQWQWARQTEGTVLADGIVYSLGEGRLAALDAASGVALWDTELSDDTTSGAERPLVLADRVVAAVGETLYLLDRESGVVVASTELGGQASLLVGPPLVVKVYGGREQIILLRIDEATGHILAQRRLEGMLYDLQPVNGMFLAVFEPASLSGSAEKLIIGLDATDLTDTWRFPVSVFPHLERIGESIYARVLLENRAPFFPIDPANGQLGPPLPDRGPTDVGGGLTWELQEIDFQDDGTAVLRRNDLATGEALWVAELPGDPGPWTKIGNHLFLHCSSGAGRGILVDLDFSNGELLNVAYGFRDAYRFAAFGDSIIATLEDEIVAFSATNFGPPEALTLAAAEEARSILERLDRDPAIRWLDEDAVAELAALGPEALPVLTEALPLLGRPGLVASALILGRAGYTAAAAPLASALGREFSHLGEWNGTLPDVAVLGALASIAGSAQVATVGRVLLDESRPAAVRREAFTTLATIGTHETTRFIEKSLSTEPPNVAWWVPADSDRWMEVAGREVSDDELQRAKGEAWSVLRRAHQVVELERPSGGSILIFPDASLGGPANLWAAVPEETGAVVTPAFFLDISLHTPGRLVHEDFRYTARLLDGMLEIAPEGDRLDVLTVDLDAARLDADGDGLTDVVERHLGLDPARRDTDDDGIKDSVDLTPNGSALPSSEDETVLWEVFRQFFTFEHERNRPGLALMSADVALDWQGRTGATLTVSDSELEAFRQRAGYNGIPSISIREIGDDQEPDDFDFVPADPSLAVGERRFALSVHRGGLDAAGYLVVMKRLEGHWVMRKCQLAWVS